MLPQQPPHTLSLTHIPPLLATLLVLLRLEEEEEEEEQTVEVGVGVGVGVEVGWQGGQCTRRMMVAPSTFMQVCR